MGKLKRVPKSFAMAALRELHTAVATGDASVVSTMLESGSAIDDRDEFGNTPLHRAAWQGDKSIVQALLSHGAKADVQRKDGKTPLDLVELRARGAGSTPPDGLSEETLRGDFRSVSALLRQETPGGDVVLQCHLRRLDSGKSKLVCTGVGGLEVASISFDPLAETLSMVQGALARQLNISQTRLRLVMPDAQLPKEVDNLLPVGELFWSFATAIASKIVGHEVLAKDDVGLLEKESHLVLNELSCSSLASASTCASISELTDGQLFSLEASFESLAYSVRP